MGNEEKRRRVGGMVVVADDDMAWRLIVEARLRLEGYGTAGTATGQDTLQSLRTLLPEFLLLDWHLAGTEGKDILDEMRQDDALSDIPVIIMSSRADLARRLEGLSRGALDFLSKPALAKDVQDEEDLWFEEELMLKIRNHQAVRQERNRARKDAEIDPLTKVGNRRYFDRSWQTHTNRWQEHHEPLSLLMVDIDHFKHINDTYGHPTGDLALIDVARVLTAAVRTQDVVCRFGGEEFAVILPDTGAEEAKRIAERIRKDVEGLQAHWGQCTVSIGVVESREMPSEEMWTTVDEALYQAKRGDEGENGGRNQVVLYVGHKDDERDET